MLKRPSAEHRSEIEKSIEQSLSGIDLLLAGDMERAMMKINARPPKPKVETPKIDKTQKTQGIAPQAAKETGT